MLPPDAEHALRSAIRARRKLRSWSRVLVVVAIGLAARIVFDAAILLDATLEPAAVRFAYDQMVLLAFLGGAVAFLSASFPKETRESAARRIDAATPALCESLEALLYLEPRQEGFAALYANRIGRRAAAVLRGNAIRSHYAPYARERRWALGLAGLCLATLLALVALEQRFDPWSALAARAREVAEAGDALEAPPLAAPEVAGEWGEVRITAPGRDLRVTKVDIVPLEIEAAASDELARARWFTAKSGEADVAHPLPEPPGAHHALFTPELYVDELHLSDWDVVAYHAGASTAGGKEFSSDIYFLEIRPFREEMMKLEQGGAARRTAFSLLGEISGLIDRQKQILRETHQHVHQPRRDAADQQGDREKLRSAEDELHEASDHLYARVATEMENQPVAQVLDHLALAQTDLGDAVAALAAPEGEPLVPEQAALRDLVASRKAFHKAIADLRDDASDEDAAGATAGLADQIRERTELRDERAAVREEVRKLLEEQRALAGRVDEASATEMRTLADTQKSLNEQLTSLGELHPRPFERSHDALGNALDAMNFARNDLGSAKGSPRTSQRSAVSRLEALHASLEAQARRGDRADAYELQKPLGRVRQRLQEVEKDPASLSEAEARELASNARSAARALDDAAPGGLDGLPGLETALDSLEGAADDAARSRAAGGARRAIEEIEADLERRTPELVRRLRERNPLEEPPDQALDDALRQIRAMAEEGDERKRSPEQRAAAARDIVDGLAPGLEGLYGSAEARSILALVESELQGEGIDPERLRDLVARIESRRVEIREAEARKADEQTLVRKDPSRLAPAYRRRVEEYFRRLSER